jgi:protein-L-isoaspartate(D-aspartate) O-methyltransferase
MDKTYLLSKLKEQGLDERTILAFEKVKREDFVPSHLFSFSYEDIPLPNVDGSSIPQPSTVAFMLKLLDLKQGQKILEIGSGSGYVLSLISEIIKEGKIYGLELHRNLAIRSKKLLERDSNIDIFIRNGFNGLKELAPFDRIIVSASAKSIPSHLIHQLSDDGVLVCPVNQSIFKIKKGKNGIEEEEHPGFGFVGLIEDE